MQRALLGVFSCVLGLSACSSPGRQAAWEQPANGNGHPPSTSTTAAASLDTEAEALWAKRDARADLEKAIAAWEKKLESDAHAGEILVRLARAHYFLADAHLALEEGDHEDRELAVYQKGVDYGERALLVFQPEFDRAMRDGAEFKDAIAKIDHAGVPAAYWYCANLGRFATKKGLSTRLYYKDRIKAAMERILQLDPDYYYGGADRYFGAFYAALPSISGKDLRQSEAHFKASLERAPQYLSTRVVEAQFLAVEREDRAMYQQLLDEVLAGADTDNADIAPENRAAKRTAKKMLQHIDEKF